MVSVGTHLGPYVIESPLGSGGMGDVFRATDTRLGRSVAIKVIRALPGSDDASARFEREARAIAALNHPNICAVHDVGHEHGIEFLVMELLVGETLERRLRAAPFAVDAILEYGSALSDALATAHAQGLVHRDLKPSNIFVTDRGPMKVLDFGLVKNVGSSDATTHVADVFRTSDGVVPGTIAYMSPEQLRGEPVDARSDIFSLGLVLYEMSTGRRAFTGSTSHHVAAAILDQTPPTPRSIRTDLPEELQRVIVKAIEKDRDLRYQSAAELRADLKRLRRDRNSGAPPHTGVAIAREVIADSASPQSSSDTAIVLDVVRRHGRVAASALLAFALLIAGTVVVIQKWHQRGTQDSDVAATADIEPLTFSGDVRYPAISPDGRFIAFARQRAVWIRQISNEGTQKDVQIVSPPSVGGYRLLAFTPDGNALDFVATARNSLSRVSLLGGTPTLIAEDVWSAPGWAPDGRRFAFVRAAAGFKSSSIVVADRDGSNQRVLATRNAPRLFANASFPGGRTFRPAWSPDGRLLAVTALSDQSPYEIVMVDTRDGTEKRIIHLSNPAVKDVNGLGQVAWLDGTKLLGEISIGPQQALGLATLDLDTDKWKPVTHDLATLQNFALTARGDVAIATRTEFKSGVWLADGQGGNARTLFDVSASTHESLAADDSGAGWYVTGANRAVYRIANGADPTLVVSQSHGYATSADGATVVVATVDDSLVRMSADGSSRRTLVDKNSVGPAIADKLKLVLYEPSGFKPGLLAVSLDGGAPQKLSDKTVLTTPRVSPDGDRVAFVTDKSLVTVCDLPKCEHTVELTVPMGGLTRSFSWAPDSRSIAYSPDDDRQNLWARPIGAGAPSQITHFDKSDLPIWDFHWSPNGRYLVLSRARFFDDVVLLKGIR
jgi:serine/threonine protein kinase/Tol biopolymer transport system component